MYPHPSKDIIGSDGDSLKDINIALCITGSVAAVRCPDIARALMRQGADVRVVMSQEGKRMITPEMMEWSTGNKVIYKLTGGLEHVEVADWADIILISPSTANTIGKIASGIDDTPPTSVVSVAEGLEKPILIVPAMHSSMYSHSIIQDNLDYLKDLGFRFLEPKFEEGKAKIPPVDEIVSFVKSAMYPRDLEGKKVLVTAGPTLERLDPVRFVTNPSSGKMGVSLARIASARGADVTLVYGRGTEPKPSGVKTIMVETTEEMLEAVEKELEGHYDLIVAAAAPQDFRPKEFFNEKMRRAEPVTIEFESTPDVLKRMSEISPGSYLVGFKAECDVTDEELREAAWEKMRECDLDLVVANDLMREGAGFCTETNEVLICSASDSDCVKTSKFEIANFIIDAFVESL